IGASNLEVREDQNDKIHTEALKRKQPSLDGKDRLLYQSRSPYKRASWTVTQKNALVQLNELRPGLQYQMLSKSGPLHAPLFSVGVEVNGSRFEGRGPTKKQAKMRAAELALQSFVQFPNAPQAHAAMASFTSAPVDFTTNDLDVPESLLKEFEPSLLRCNTSKQEVFSSIYNHRRLIRFTLDLPSSTNPKRRAVSASVLERLSPVVLLNELQPGLRYVCLTERVPGRPMRNFVMVVRLEGRVFEGLGHSKRLAKAQAAAAALQSLYNISLEPERRIQGFGSSRAKHQLPQVSPSSIFHLVTEKYTELTDSGLSASHTRHKVLAGIVMTRGLDLRSARVVSLATGTRCLDSGHVNDGGCLLRDCHAEVVSRRALVRFLYTQLELLLWCTLNPDRSSSLMAGGGFRLQDGVLFHMYISSSPCGDARLGCPYERGNPLGGSALQPGLRLHCRLRSKVGGGEGTLPVTARTASQEPLRSMSCTDKMAKWSVVGLQGALLSHLVEPVYLHSLTVGTLGHTGHLSRAMTRRLAPRRSSLCFLSGLGSAEVRPAGKAPGASLNWSLGDAGLEEVSSSTGRTKASGAPSRLCRRSLSARWLRLQQQVSSEGSEGKLAAGRYQKAVQQLHGALQDAGLGTWLQKPAELGSFTVSA
uniref:Adenosine deaminase RNA specific B2 (inactive) n=1 Tax=Salarias fasciatus TaxID=181472 RepID=A0A672H8X5_SALFA